MSKANKFLKAPFAASQTRDLFTGDKVRHSQQPGGLREKALYEERHP